MKSETVNLQLELMIELPSDVSLKTKQYPIEEVTYARRRLDRRHHRVFCRFDRVCAFLRSPEVGRGFMDIQSLIMLVISALVTVYLFYALLRPEKF